MASLNVSSHNGEKGHGLNGSYVNPSYQFDANDVTVNTNFPNTVASTSDRNLKHPYGWKCISSDSLQFLNRPLFFLICLSFSGIAQGLAVSGISLSALTSIEKQFGLKSSEVALFTTMYDTAYGICSIFIGYMCYTHKPRSIGWGLLIMAFGAVIVSLPKFIIGTYYGAAERYDDFCNLGNSTVSDADCNKSKKWYYEFIFNLGYVILGIGATPLYILGPAHIDEVTNRGESSLYLGVYYAACAVGPALGFIIALPVLNTWVDIQTPLKSSLTPADANWVGAWWLGFLIGAFLLLLPVIPLLGFPEKFPDTDELKIRKLKICDTIPENNKLKRGWPATKALLKNPPFIFISLALAFESLATGGFSTFIPKFLETQFHFTASMSALYTGLVGIPGAAGGVLFGGYLVKRFRWNCREVLKYAIIMSFIGMLFTAFILVGCNEVDIERQPSYYFNHSCNSECHCNSLYYKPICSIEDQKTFYSACYAGCQHENQKNNLFYNCSCFSFNVTHAESGRCSPKCSFFPLFVVGTFFLVLFTFMNNVPLINATFRVVNEGQGSLAMGCQQIVIRFLGFIPSPLLYGSFIDLSCTLWQTTKCSDDTTNCLEYNHAYFRYYMFSIALVTKFLSFVCITIAYKYYRLPKKSDEAELPS